MRASLIALGAAVPYVIEVLMQLPLLTRVMAALPQEARARLPPHPRSPRLAVFGSARFFLALFRFALRDERADDAAMRALKRQMRLSAWREAAFGLSFAATAVLLWRHGWRPFGS